MNILFTCAGRRNYLINYFKDAVKGKGKIFAADMLETAPALIDADIAIILPSIYDASYINQLSSIIKKHQIDAVISLNDLELPILCANKELIEQSGAKLLVSNQEVINISFDKWESYLFLQQCGLDTPKTYINYEAALKDIDQGLLTFPLVIKPRWGSASIGIEFPENKQELELAYQLLKLRLRRSILSQVSQQDFDQSILIQECIGGQEYGMDVLNDFNGHYKGSFVREKLAMRGGETDKAKSIIDPRFEQLGQAIGEKLNHIGNLDCDVFESEGTLYVLELNPRFGGGYPFSHEAGMNTAKTYVSWLNDEDSFAENNKYQADIVFSKCDRLLKIN